ncbi:MAG TPA: polyprenol monophosphomannose synthase [Candidatus Saccharimonadales bacterium]|nr:polyprenol monophosphomannose synthase [Candidatus Saccharimonadales bacterium]
MKLAIAVPTYNEAINISKLLPAIKKHVINYQGLECTVFIIDDNSPDGTADIATAIGKKISDKKFNVRVLNRAKKEGLGRAYVFAFQQIIPENFDYILQMDADLSHDPKYIPEFLDQTKNADFVVGSRYIKGGSTPDWQWYRKLQSRGGNFYARLFLGSKITDYTGGYNLYSQDLLKKIKLETLQAGGYGFLIDLKHKALMHCKNAVQVPIVFKDRQHGNSKIPRSTIIKNFLLVPSIRYRG